MDIRTTRQGRRITLELQGTWNETSAGQLREVTALFLERGVVLVTLDLGGVSGVDGTIVSPLADLFKRVNALWGELTLRAVPESLQTILKATQLTRVIEVEVSGTQATFDAAGPDSAG